MSKIPKDLIGHLAQEIFSDISVRIGIDWIYEMIKKRKDIVDQYRAVVPPTESPKLPSTLLTLNGQQLADTLEWLASQPETTKRQIESFSAEDLTKFLSYDSYTKDSFLAALKRTPPPKIQSTAPIADEFETHMPQTAAALREFGEWGKGTPTLPQENFIDRLVLKGIRCLRRITERETKTDTPIHILQAVTPKHKAFNPTTGRLE